MNTPTYDSATSHSNFGRTQIAETVPPFAGGREMVMAALALHREFGDDAIVAAALRSAQSRSRGNVASFCQWREVERLLSLDGTQSGCATRH